MSAVQSELKKPIRPLTAYHLFFQLEREYILQNIIIIDDDANSQVDARPSGKELDAEMPTRYQNIHLSPLWYVSASGKRKRTQESDQKRKHRKSHGKISFQELSRTVASRWASLEESDNETKMYCTKIAKRELNSYKERVKVYKASVAAVEKQNAKKATASITNSDSHVPLVSPEMASAAYLPSSFPALNLADPTGGADMAKSPNLASISMNGSSSLDISPELNTDLMKKRKHILAGCAMAEPETRNKNTVEGSDFSFIPLPVSLQEQEDLFLKHCQTQKKARYTEPTSSNLCLPRQDDAYIEDVVFDSNMKDLDTYLSNMIKSESESTRKRSGSDVSCGNISPLQCYGDSAILTEYNFTTDDAQMLLRALF